MTIDASTQGASVRGGPARLGVDLTPSGLTAVIDTDGDPQPLVFDGAPYLPAVVLVEADGELAVGAAALTGGVGRPDRLVPDPAGLNANPADVDGIDVDPVRAAAALLGQVAQRARSAAGAAGIGEVLIGLPSAWGPGRRTRLRRAAGQAGLGQVHVIDTLTALATRHAGVDSSDQVVVVRHDGVYAEAAVLHRYGDSVETLAALESRGRDGTDPTAMAAEAITAAELHASDLSGVYCLATGPNDLAPLAGNLRDALGVTVTPIVGGGLAAARAILDTYRAPSAASPRRTRAELVPAALRAVVPAIAAVILLVQGVGGTDVYGDPPGDTLVITDWAAFITASVCTVLAGTAMAQFLTGHLRRRVDVTAALPTQLGALSITTALTVIYALVAASSTKAPVTTFLPWTTIPALGVAITIAASVLASRAVGRPIRSFPLAALCLGAAGVIAIAAANVNIPATPREIWPALLRGGAGLVGVAIAFVVTTRRRWLLAPPLAAILAVVAGLNTTRTIAILLTITIAIWWIASAIRDGWAHPAMTALLQPSSQTTEPNHADTGPMRGTADEMPEAYRVAGDDPQPGSHQPTPELPNNNVTGNG